MIKIKFIFRKSIIRFQIWEFIQLENNEDFNQEVLDDNESVNKFIDNDNIPNAKGKDLNISEIKKERGILNLFTLDLEKKRS